MKLPPKRWALATVPPVLLIVVHLAWLRPPLAERCARAAQRIEDSKRAGGDREEVSDVSDEIARLERESRELDQRRDELLARWTRSDQRVKTVSDVSSILLHHGVQIERSSQARDESSLGAGAVPRRLARTLSGWGGDDPELWQLDVRATYPRLLAALEECSDYEDFCLVVSLAASLGESTDDLSFSLWLWI